MKWVELKTEAQLDEIREESKQSPVLIFKHSSRCSISRAALDRLERNWKEEEVSPVKPYFLDLISFRSMSDSVASQFDVEHESPQVLIIENGRSVCNQSHFDINYTHILKAIKG